MKITVEKRQVAEDGDHVHLVWSTTLEVETIEDAIEKGAEFMRLLDAIGQGMNRTQEEWAGR